MSASSIAVVVPAYREERLIEATIRGLPQEVERIIVVDDASPDETARRARAVGDPRVVVVCHKRNQGVGAAILTGYQEALQGSCRAIVVMAGDNQMDPADLATVASPVLDGTADYVKGNRIIHPRQADMPRARRLGTRVLAWVTSLACGIPLGDSQCGYTAISRRAAEILLESNVWPRYGYPNDVLITLVARGLRIAETPVRPVYADEQSGLRAFHMVSILGVILRRTLRERRALFPRSPTMAQLPSRSKT